MADGLWKSELLLSAAQLPEKSLEELEIYFGDSHLHVLAAAGSGNTVLGLQVMLRRAGPA